MPESVCPTDSEVLLFLTGGNRGPEATCVLAHLDECTSCRLAVGEAALELTRSKSADHIRTFEEGEVVGRYRIDRLVGRGGMGEVYQAFDQVLLERVALKTVRLGILDDARALMRFKAEVQLARKVSHPHVCRVLEFGLGERSSRPGAAETIPFFTMEFLEGQTLSEKLRREGRLPWPEVAALAIQLARGLDAIHAAGIVHRDFKSENVILVAARGESPRALVTDFGLARVDQADRSDASSFGGVVGTIDYVAPEQVLGSVATPQSDVFALGVVMFEMLSGRRPYGGEDRLQKALSRVHADAPTILSLVPELPARWDPILVRCLARNPPDRYQKMSDLIAALEAVASPPAVVPGASIRASVRWLVAGASVVLLTAAVAAALSPRRPPARTLPPPGGMTRSVAPDRAKPAVSVHATRATVAVPSTEAAVAVPSTEAASVPPRRRSANTVRPAAATPVRPAATKQSSTERPRQAADREAAPGQPVDHPPNARDGLIKPDFASGAIAPRSPSDRVVSPFSAH